MSRKHSHEYVYNYFKEHGCELLEEYKDARTPMKYRCKCGNVSTIRFYDFKNGKRCRKCLAKKLSKKQRTSYEDVKRYFEENGCILLSKEYINNKQKLDYICSCGNKSKISFDSFKRGSRCRKCSSKKRAEKSKLSIEEIKQILKSQGCELLDNSYINYDNKIKYKCSCGNIAYGYIGNIKKGIKCGCQHKSGEEHPLWNPNLSQEDREKKRKYQEYYEWVKNVFERDNYTCQRCGQFGGKLNAHHIYNYAEYKELRTDVSNGITLCKECHKEFHKTYGYSRNNEYQIKEFINDYKTKVS